MGRASRLAVALGASLALAGGTLAAVPAAAAAPAAPRAAQAQGPDVVEVYTGVLSGPELATLRAAGLDHEDIAMGSAVGAGKGVRVRVEVTTNAATVAALAADGVRLHVKKVDGKTSTELAALAAAEGRDVFRPFTGPGGLEEELRALTAANPGTTKLVELGRSLQGRPILAVKVTKQATRVPDGTRPATAFISAQHAREWITPEMTRRLLRHVVGGYGKDAEITSLVDTTELWFVPVVNPDGYDHTFTADGRNWRKNRRANEDGTTGVDPNRNYPVHWGYDNEGSSPDPVSDTYRGPAPASERETQAITGLMAKVKPEFLINYHSAAELILYGAGFQVATPTPDDLIYSAMAGDDAHPAVEGYDPDLSAELYTTNGDTDDTAHNDYGVLAFTPEMSTCETASAKDPDDAHEPGDCASVFTFPDDEGLVQAEFEKNLPFALATARSAHSPDAPVSVVGRTVPDFDVDSFSVSYGDPQTVAVTARRSLTDLRLHYRIAGGAVQTARVAEWTGGQVYGDENDVYFAEYRGVVTGARPGQQVEVWFSGVKRGTGPTESERFTYTLTSDSGDPVLVLADEDYSGALPTYPTGLEFLSHHQQAVTDAGYASDLWDSDRAADGVPHPLGVLSHYDAVVWYTGANRLTADQEDVFTATPFGSFPFVSVAERQQYLTMAVRDYMNEGGKVVVDGELAQYYGDFTFVGGIYYGLNGDETADCVISSGPGLFDDCLILADDFSQYWLGAGNRTTAGEGTGFQGTGDGLTGTFGLGTPTADIPSSAFPHDLDEAGAFTVTSDELPVTQFPQFRSWKAGDYVGAGGRKPFGPYLGQQYAAALHVDESYQRLGRTVDLSGAASASLDFATSFNTEGGYDHVIVEAHTVGQDDWTTVPITGGAESHTDVPIECEAGFLLAMHPFLTRYLTDNGASCSPTGTSGSWNSLTGSSGGWREVSADLSAFAGKQVEVFITYVTDPATGGVGVFVDEAGFVVDGVSQPKEGFETGAGAFVVPGAPAGSPGNASDWQFAPELVDVAAAVATPRSLLLGFGLEHVTDPAERTELVRQALQRLIG